MDKKTLLSIFALIIILLPVIGFGAKGLAIGGCVAIFILSLDVIINDKS